MDGLIAASKLLEQLQKKFAKVDLIEGSLIEEDNENKRIYDMRGRHRRRYDCKAFKCGECHGVRHRTLK